MTCSNCHATIDLRASRCWSCGTIIPPSQFLLEESGVVPPDEPSPAPPATRAQGLFSSPPVVAVDSYPVASLGDRGVALALDSLLLLVVFAIVTIWAYLRWSVPVRGEWVFTAASLVICATLDFAIFFLYFWTLEAAFGATLGKAIMGIRVLGNGQRGAPAASAIRNLLRIVDGLGFYLVGLTIASCSRFRKRLGDVFAGTTVVAPQLSAWTRPLAIALWVGLFAATGWAAPRIYFRGHAGHRLPVFGRAVARFGRTDSSVYVRVARFKVELQRNDDQHALAPAIAPPAPAPVALAGD